MFEKVNCAHPDKVSDRIAGAIVDLAYAKDENVKIAVEVLIGHGQSNVIIESSEKFTKKEIQKIVDRIVGEKTKLNLLVVPQDKHLSKNQEGHIRCGDNGIFKGVPTSEEEKKLTKIAKDIYEKYHTDGKYILDGDKLIICQSNATLEDLQKDYPNAIINPLGYWTGGINSDSGATCRKLGSDMGRAVTGGGLCMSGDTEYIGEDLQWHKIKDYTTGKVGQWNNGILEFVQPLKFIHNPKDEFILFKNDTKLSMELTPYHQILIKTSKGHLIKKDAIEIAKKLENGVGNSGRIIHNFKFNFPIKNSKYQDENEYRLQVAFCADGTILKSNGKWGGRIRVKKQYKKERLRLLLKNKNYRESIDGEYSIFWFKPTLKNKSLYECFKDENLDILYDEVFKWDGDEKIKLFRTTHKEDADFIQFVIGCQGYTATITKENNVGTIRKLGGKSYIQNSNCYIVNQLKSVTTHLRESKGNRIDIIYEKELKDSYCFEVPSHNLIMRHNDRIFITGNCGKDLSKADVSVNIYAFLKAQETNKVVELSCAIGDEFVDGRPYEEIVKIAKDYIDSLGGFEKFAEWGLIR